MAVAPLVAAAMTVAMPATAVLEQFGGPGRWSGDHHYDGSNQGRQAHADRRRAELADGAVGALRAARRRRPDGGRNAADAAPALYDLAMWTKNAQSWLTMQSIHLPAARKPAGSQIDGALYRWDPAVEARTGAVWIPGRALGSTMPWADPVVGTYAALSAPAVCLPEQPLTKSSMNAKTTNNGVLMTSPQFDMGLRSTIPDCGVEHLRTNSGGPQASETT